MIFFIIFYFLNNLIIPSGSYKIGLSKTEASILKIEETETIKFLEEQIYELRNQILVMPTKVTWKEYKLCIEEKACSIPDYPQLWKNYFILNENDYRKFLKETGMKEDEKYFKNLMAGNYPIEVEFSDALDFCKFKNMRIPSIYEYEIIQRGGLNENVYFWGNEWNDNYVVSGLEKYKENKLVPVKTKLPNKFGLYDISGNVFEYTSSFYCKENGLIFDDLIKCKDKCQNCLIIIKGGSKHNKIKKYFANAIFSTIPIEDKIKYSFRCVK